MYRPEELDQLIDIYEKSLVSDGGGGHEATYTKVNTVWAKVKPLSGRETEESDQVRAQSGYMFVIRNHITINENYQIRWQGNAFNIRFVKNRGTRTLYLEIECEQGVAQ